MKSMIKLHIKLRKYWKKSSKEICKVFVWEDSQEDEMEIIQVVLVHWKGKWKQEKTWINRFGLISRSS